jgi:hypothetical protein
MDGGVATQRAKDLLATLRGEVEGLADLEGAHEIDWSTRERNLAEYLRGAYTEGYSEGLAAKDAALARIRTMKDAYDKLVEYVSRNGRTKVLHDILNTIFPRFSAVVQERLNLSHTKQAQLLDALLDAVRAAATEPTNAD